MRAVPAQHGNYVIQKGDTLFQLAECSLGAGARWPEIVALNPGLVPEKLRVGQKIRLPAKAQ